MTSDNSKYRRVRFEWIPPATLPKTDMALWTEMAGISDTGRAESADVVLEGLRKFGHLGSTGATSPKDELLALLQLAVEVEHALLVQYLYAATSIDPAAPAHLTVKNIAVQEMAHLITVQNLLLAIGGPSVFHIGRDTFRAASLFNPLPLNLEPISQLTLGEYVLAESPGIFPPGKEGVQRRVAAIKREVEKKTGLHPSRVGAIYTKIYWIFQPSDNAFGPLALKPDPTIGLVAGWHVKPKDFTPAGAIKSHQAEPAEWQTKWVRKTFLTLGLQPEPL